MNLLQLLTLYLLVGGGCAAFVLVRAPAGSPRAADAVLVAALWPLYGPFLVLGSDPPSGALRGEVEFLVALRRAAATPLGKLLPDEATARALARRLRVAGGKVEEIDRLLTRPEFSESAALARSRELEAKGASARALATAGNRIQNIRRLKGLRDRFARELDEVQELLAQLATQAEVVRLAGEPDAASRQLVRELVCRVEGLDEMFEADVLMLESETPGS